MLLATILSAWLQYAADGPQARAVVDDRGCPTAILDDRLVGMRTRAAAVPAFPGRVCVAAVPVGTRSIRIGTRSLPPPLTAAPRTVVVFGDTGCRLKGSAVQGCDDPVQWPFPAVARSIAALHPDLIVHVGDYYYRETPCPRGAACAGSPYGDNARAWTADWFAPGASLFAAAPLVLARGNHEDCARGGPGWFHYLDAFPSPACAEVTAPYAVTLQGLRIVVLDSANADDANAPAQLVSAFRSAFDAARSLAGGETWLVTHRPPYTNATERAAMGNLRPFSAVLAGHIHLFAALDVAGQPPLVVNGEGGDLLDTAAAPFLTAVLGDLRPTAAPYVSLAFGFAVYTRIQDGWSISLRDPHGVERKRCTLAEEQVRC
jgi:hypothetical protein